MGVVLEFAKSVLHGDAEHQRWLMNAATEYENKKKIEALERDALRYRWLRDSDNFPVDDQPDESIWDSLCEKDRGDFDNAIDGWMQSDTEQEA